MVVAVAAAVVAGIALARAPAATPPQIEPASPPSAPPAPSAAVVAAAKKEACDAWSAAAAAINAARHPFILSPLDWNDPATIGALTGAEAGIVVQVEYVRQHVRPETPPEVGRPIFDYIAAAIDTVAADGQHQPAGSANAAALRSSAAAGKIQAACGL
jgi:hypothetical protein